MRNAGTRITSLCESWLAALTDAAKQEHPRFAQELLRLLDWEQPVPFSPHKESETLGAAPYLLRAGGQTTIMAYFTLPGTLDPPSSVVDRGLDFCPATRGLVNESRSLHGHYVWISDLNSSYFYDARTDELLLWADTPRIFETEMSPILKRAAVERGSLDEARRPPRSFVARQLREWRSHWQTQIETVGRVTETQSALVMDRLAVMRFLFEHEIFRRTKWRLQQRFDEIEARAWSASTEGCGGQLVRLFHDMWFDWKMALFEADPMLDRALSRDEIAAPLLRELGLLSRSKFCVATLLESFNHGEPAEKMRVRMVPDANEDRDHYLTRQTLETIDRARIEVDLAEEGYRAIFHWFDKVVALYERLGAEFDRKNHSELPQQDMLDLFSWSERDAHRPSACGDHMAHACGQGILVYYNSPQQFRVARLLLTLHLIARYHENRHPVNEFPPLEQALAPRPKVLPVARVIRQETFELDK